MREGVGRKKRIEGGSKRARGGERKSEQAARVVATAAHQRLDTISINPASGLDCKQSWTRTPNVKRCATAAAAAAVAYQTVVPGEAVVVFLTCARPPYHMCGIAASPMPTVQAWVGGEAAAGVAARLSTCSTSISSQFIGFAAAQTFFALDQSKSTVYVHREQS